MGERFCTSLESPSCSGMANAKAKGAKIGRPRLTKENIPAKFLRHYPSYKSGNLNVSELARVCGVSRGTVYKYYGVGRVME